MTLAELIEEFKSDPNRRSMRKKVELDYGLLFRAMDEVIGHDSRLADISRDDCKAVRELLLRLPSNATKKFPGISLREAAAKPEAEEMKRLNPVTVNSYLHKMSALFNYAVKEDRIDKNPARGLGIEGHDHTEEDRLPFSTEQLTRIFHSTIYTGCVDDKRRWSRPGSNRPRGTRFWIPIIALFHGMRLNEICQLRVDDIETIDGVPVFNIRPSAGTQRVKTEAGRRIVPFHPFLKRLRFETYVATMRKTGEDQLFPDLKADKRGYYSDAFQKWFDRLLGHVDAEGDRTSFHSFRHNWRDAMREAGVPQERVRLIGGWKRTSTDEKYGVGLSAKSLLKDIAKVRGDLALHCNHPADRRLRQGQRAARRAALERRLFPGGAGAADRLGPALCTRDRLTTPMPGTATRLGRSPIAILLPTSAFLRTPHWQPGRGQSDQPPKFKPPGVGSTGSSSERHFKCSTQRVVPRKKPGRYPRWNPAASLMSLSVWPDHLFEQNTQFLAARSVSNRGIHKRRER